MTTQTNRLDDIANRQRTARVMDLLFAAMIAFLMIWSIASLRVASANAETAGLKQAPAVQQVADTGAACDVDVAC